MICLVLSEYCKSIYFCAPLFVQISRVVENRKLSSLQKFFDAFHRLVPTTRRTQ